MNEINTHVLTIQQKKKNFVGILNPAIHRAAAYPTFAVTHSLAFH